MGTVGKDKVDVVWEGGMAHLLDVSVGGLPHVVILNDAGERFPWELGEKATSWVAETGLLPT